MLNSVNVLIIVMTLANVMGITIFGSLRHADIPGVNRWMAANLVAVLSLTLMALRDISPIYLSVIAGNLLAIVAALLSHQSCRQFFGLRPVSWPFLAAGLLVLVGLAYWTYIEPDADTRIVVVLIFLACAHGATGWIAWTRRIPRMPLHDYRFMLAIAVVTVLSGPVRAVIFGVGLSNQQTLLLPSALIITLLALSMFFLPGMSSGMVMLAYNRMTAQLERWAHVDDLTKALTRRSFFEKLQDLAGQVRIASGTFSVVILDLDHFKAINDNHGHAVGDQVLAHLGRFISARIRHGDVFGRLGGEEFAILFPGLDRQTAQAKVRALLLDLHSSQVRAGDIPRYTFSAGLDEYQSGESIESLMLRADTALYQAKEQGRNRVLLAAREPVGQAAAQAAG